MKKLILLTAVFFCAVQFSDGQSGKADSTFGIYGTVKANFGQRTSFPSKGVQVLPRSDGSMFVLCNTKTNTTFEQSFITKLDGSGAIDYSYGMNGASDLVRIRPLQAAIQPDGKMVVLGGYNVTFALTRYNINGSLDTTFGSSGKQSVAGKKAYRVAIQNDGKILVAGSTFNIGKDSFRIERYGVNGGLDKTFSGDGVQTIDFSPAAHGAKSQKAYYADVAVQGDGKIILAGNSVSNLETSQEVASGIARLNDNGTLDSTFSGDGQQIIQGVDDTGAPYDFVATRVLAQNNGRIFVAGRGLICFQSNGTPDSSFSADGIESGLINSEVNGMVLSMVIQTDGKINVLVPYTNELSIIRFNSNGTHDSSFSKQGILKTIFTPFFPYSMALEPGGKILLTGSVKGELIVARYNTDGTIDNSFDGDGQLTGGYPEDGSTIFRKVVMQKDGKSIICGSAVTVKNISTFFIARYNTTGNLDTSFSHDGIQPIDIDPTSIAVDNVGKIVVSGLLRNKFVLARYKTDGSSDSEFNSRGETSFPNGPFAIQKDNKIVIVSTRMIYDSEGYPDHPTLNVVRYNVNGTVDSTFYYDGTSDRYLNDNGYPTSIGMLSNGTVVVGANAYGFRIINFVLAFFDSTGTLVRLSGGVFVPQEEITETLHSLTVQHDDKIIVQGKVGPWRAIARYNADGSLDGTFGTDGINIIRTGNIIDWTRYNTGVAIQDDGKLVMQGEHGIIRFHSNGSNDSTFSGDGTLANSPGSIINSIAIADNKLYTAGYAPDSRHTVGELDRYFLTDKPKTPPLITLTIPVNNAIYLAGGNVYLNAMASDADGKINKVDFYNGSSLLYTETHSPYTFKWQDVYLGNYTLTAKATDNSGLVTTSASVNISVVRNTPPTVSITIPANDQTFSAGANIHLAAEAHDADGRIVQVSFYNGTTLLTREHKAPYTYEWKNVPAGTYTITAVAKDNWSDESTSTPKTVTVVSGNAPMISSRSSSACVKTGTNEQVSLRLLPNPAKTILNIYTTGLQSNKRSAVSVISASGLLFQQVNYLTNNQYNNSTPAIQLDVSSLLSGVYTLKLISGDKVMYRKFVKM